jgi:hypothetical protein
MIDIFDKTYEPSFIELTNYVKGDSNKRWKDLTNYIESNFKSKPTMFYSKCSAKPGWNVKYKKSSKALCTLYPDTDYFTALIVLSETDMEWFKGMRDNYSKYILDLYDNCNLFNGTKWLMINITDDKILKDVKNLISLKLN